MTEALETLEGCVLNITFYNDENGYTVLKLEPIKLIMGVPGGVVTVLGTLPEIQPGENMRFEGTWTNNPKYGKQFKAETFMRVLPVTEDGIRRYLGSGLIKGVGPATADRLVDYFGLQTIQVLSAEDAAQRLQEVPKLGKHRAGLIVEAWAQQREMADVMMFLQQYQVGTALSLKIYRFYKEQDLSAIQVLREEPYQLIRDIRGVGFKTADRIAQNLGLPPDSDGRLQAALVYLLEDAESDGHVFFPAEELLAKALELIEMDDRIAPKLRLALENLIAMGAVRPDQVPLSLKTKELSQVIYLPPLYYSERGAASQVIELVITKESPLESINNFSDNTWDTLFSETAEIIGVALTDQQRQAVKIALTNKMSILTGGPGTGKTTTLRTLITLLDALDGIKYMLASPTGRAAKRLSQTTDRPAMTIHRMLGYSLSNGFVHNAENTLEADFIIIDETSMIDIHLFYALMRAISPDSHLLLVGDVDQLPSVGAGDVLRDVINSEVCPVTRLNAIFRQAQGSQIIQSAHDINLGKTPTLDNKSEDFYFFSEEDPQKAADLLVDIVQNRIPNKFGYDAMRDIQVLSPMYRTPVGVQALNELLQAKLNPPGRVAERRFGGHLLRVGDRVMQTRNNYEKGVFNGDMGRIYSLNLEKQLLTVSIDDNHHEYHWDEVDQLTLAYACSVHRSQGSEYPVVVIPLLTQHYMMLQRNLLYTAITRARKMVVLVGTRKAVDIAVRNNKVAHRWTALDWRLGGDF